MKFKDIIITSLIEDEETIKLEDTFINEGLGFPFTPLIAYSAFKKKTFNQYNKENKFVKFPENKIAEFKEKIQNIKAKGLIEKEKIRARLGITSGNDENATVYKLTKEQLDILAEIYSKYGKEIIKEINYFRVNTLAPYQLIKRIIKKSKAITSTDVVGMTKDEFRTYYESGKKKILRAGEVFDKSKETENKIRGYEENIKNLEVEKEKLSSGKNLSSSILEKLYSKFNTDEKNFGKYSLGDLKKSYDEYIKNLKSLKSYNKVKKEKLTPEDILNLVKRQKDITSGKNIEASKEKEIEKEEQNISFSSAFNRYMLRKEIRESLRKKFGNDIYKNTYNKIIDEEIKELRDKKRELMAFYIDIKKKIDLNEKEKMIWKSRPGSTTNYSGKLEDYYQAIREQDFKEPEYIERPKELQEAEQEIENEIKRFERKLGEIIEKDDLEKLKKYRLINNLITVKELKDPNSLFRTEEELHKLQTQKLASTIFVDEDDFINKIKEISTVQYETREDLNKAKTELRGLAQKLRRQNDVSIIQKHAEEFRVALMRKNLEGKLETEEKPKEEKEKITIENIKQIISIILNRQYSAKEEINNDEERLNLAIEEFKKQDEDAIFKLEEIKEELDKANKKINFAKETI